MTIYLINIITTFLLGEISTSISRVKRDDQEVGQRKVSLFCVMCILLLWTLVYALRDYVGSDYETYRLSFLAIGRKINELSEFIKGQRDILFGVYTYVCYRIFDGDWNIYLATLGIITYLPILVTLKKESISFEMSSLLYIFMMFFYSGYNGTRQSIAVSMAFMAYFLFFRHKKYKLYFIIMLIAYGFHATVLFVWPFHLLTLKGLRSRIFKYVVGFMLFAYVFLWNLWMYLIRFFEAIGQDKLAKDYANATTNGSSFIRLTVYLLPVVIAVLFYKKIREKYQNVDCEIIFMILSAIFMLFSTKYWLFARIAEYFSIATILFIPKLECIFSQNSKVIGKLCIMLLYFMFMCMLLLSGEGNYYPYKMISL